MRYYSWLFATEAMRAPLLGIYALTAEWTALLDPATERDLACMKLSWWREEMLRLKEDTAVHPISRHLRGMSRNPASDFAPLAASVTAALAEAGGVPLETRRDLEPHAAALYGTPLDVAARLGDPASGDGRLTDTLTALAEAQYVLRAIAGYRRAARMGRIVFPVDELLAAGLDNAALAADPPPTALSAYLNLLEARAFSALRRTAERLPEAQRHSQRHLLVLAELHARSAARKSGGLRYAVGDMLHAWNAARRA